MQENKMLPYVEVNPSHFSKVNIPIDKFLEQFIFLYSYDEIENIALCFNNFYIEIHCGVS